MPNKKSVNIKLPRRIVDIQQVDKWEDLWNSSDYATYSIPEDLSVDEIYGYFAVFMSKLPNTFAFTILEEIAELENTPCDLLEQLFETGNTDCMVAICCRSDLSDKILKKCLSSSNTDVLEHVVFQKHVSISDCEALLQRPLEKYTAETIQRAISQKKGEG